MQVASSKLIEQKKPVLKQLLDRLLENYSYASVLMTDSKGKNYAISNSGIVIGENSMFMEQAYVVKVYDGTSYGEYAFSHIDENEIDTIAEEVKNHVKGAEVIFQDVHVSGHACQEEIKLIYTLVHPKYAIPVHGEYKHLKAQAGIAQELGIQKENIFILRSGNVLELNEEKAGVTGQVAAGAILVDGLGIGDVGNVVLRDRQHLAEDGIMIVVVALDSISGQIASGPDLVSRGFVYVKESDALMDEARDLMENVMEGCVSRGCTDWGRIKTAIKDNLGDFIWKKTKRRPMILPIIMEV